MTTELEKQFFYTFDIPPKIYNSSLKDWEFPPITDRILLELICILVKCMEDRYSDYDCYKIWKTNYKDLKESILDDCICYRELNDIEQQIQALFKEG